MNVFWWFCLVGLVLFWYWVQVTVDGLVRRLTKRESCRPEDPNGAACYTLVSFVLMLGIAILPLYLLPNLDPLVLFSFFALGSTVSSVAVQGFFGRKVSN